MLLQIQKWGNGAAIRLNKALLKQISSDIGGRVEAEVIDGGIFLKPVRGPEYSLRELLASCTKENVRLDEQDKVWSDDNSEGKEIW